MAEFQTQMFLETMRTVQRIVHETAKAKGFWDEGQKLMIEDGCNGPEPVQVKTRPFNLPEKLMLMVSELAEAMECHRDGTAKLPDNHCPDYSRFAIEMADAVIRIMDLCEHLEIDLAEAILAKSTFNKSRPQRHEKNY